jgi:hypothetical protein
MLKPQELETELPYGPYSCRGCDVWDMLCAAADGDAAELRRLLDRDPNLYRAEYWYTQPIHFAVREGHIDAVRALLDAGADPSWVSLTDEPWATPLAWATRRGHRHIVEILRQAGATA